MKVLPSYTDFREIPPEQRNGMADKKKGTVEGGSASVTKAADKKRYPAKEGSCEAAAEKVMRFQVQR